VTERSFSNRQLGVRILAACLFASALITGGAVAAATPATQSGTTTNDTVKTKEAPPAPPASLDNSTNGLPGHQIVTSAPLNCAAGGFCFVSVACPPGKLVTGGGASNSALGTIILTDSRPNGNNGWGAWLKNNGAAAGTITAWAVCVTP
jgi:hypothetical protein